METARKRRLAAFAAAAKDPQGLAARIEPHLEWMGVAAFSADTIHVRRLYLRYFVAWCEERGIGKPEEVSPAAIEQYQRWLYHYKKTTGQPLAIYSQHGRLLAVKAWFKWMVRTKQIAYNPAAELDLPRVSKHRLPRSVLSVEEVEKVLALPNVEEPMGIRDRAILETFYSTGMRRMELMALKLYDISMERGVVQIWKGKGQKDRVVPIGERALAWIEKYLVEVRPVLVVEPDPGIVFLTNLGLPFTANHLSQLARDYVKAAGIGKPGACHLFRHTMATLMLEGGADIRFIQELLGHEELTTTQIYTRVSIAKLKEIHTVTHPGAKLATTRNVAAEDR